ncbi:MAG: tRNA (N6-isopentenyl adenosine(37)-C2)-methylthiotransferase MiaB [Oscillospiraceae bacterium]|nr:tRNA (N6-isopentenyl adenosine(37)-C2)-methylthiotransferase MiaB [Oscillospiraceae bacterium]
MEYLTFTPDGEAARLIASAYPQGAKAYMRSFGCQQNVNDGERIKGVLASMGYMICDSEEEADLIVFNTCAVREHAEQRVLGNIGALKPLKERKRGLMIAICGCMVQQEAVVEKLRKSYPYVDIVFGPNAIDTLPGLIARRLREKKRVLLPPSQRTDIVEALPARRESAFKAFIPIMYGCDNFCSYCIVPYVRGRERSRRPADVLAEFRSLVEQGYRDITLLGQNVNSYGKGLEQPVDFGDLLTMLDAVPGDYRLRFMTSHPKDATPKMIDIIAGSRHISHHLHLPVQSGSDRILREMNRKYTRADYLKLIAYAKEKMPDVSFTSDILVGFPGETEEDFEDTLSLVTEVGYMQLFTFIYSKRSGTRAASLPDPVSYREKTQRIARLKERQEACVKTLLQGLTGTVQRVLVEEKSRFKGRLCGRMDNNCMVEFLPGPNMKNAVGEYQNVRITGFRNSVLLGAAEDLPTK